MVEHLSFAADEQVLREDPAEKSQSPPKIRLKLSHVLCRLKSSHLQNIEGESDGAEVGYDEGTRDTVGLTVGECVSAGQQHFT